MAWAPELEKEWELEKWWGSEQVQGWGMARDRVMAPVQVLEEERSLKR